MGIRNGRPIGAGKVGASSVYAQARKPFRDFVYRATQSDGSAVYNKISGKPVFDANGEFRGYRGTGTDVTALRTAEGRSSRKRAAIPKAQLELAHANRVATMAN